MKIYNTLQGDTWDLIAFKTLGTEYAMDAIMEANPEKIKTRVFKGGEKLLIPESPASAQKVITPPWSRP